VPNIAAPWLTQFLERTRDANRAPLRRFSALKPHPPRRALAGWGFSAVCVTAFRNKRRPLEIGAPVARVVIVLALAARSRLDVIGLGEPTMQPRESAPLWVGLTFVLMIVATVMCVTGYFMVEDLLTFFK
jgi:hypothetical protein